MVIIIGVILVTWLIGSIPSAYIVTRIVLGKDIRSIGSGNVGATNVFRALGPKYAISVFLFDFLKGFLPVLLILRGGIQFSAPSIYIALFAGTAAIAGHIFPFSIGWKGGKGVATGAGVISALYPPLFPACLTFFLLTFLISRRISVASVLTAITVPFWYFFLASALQYSVNWILLVYLTLIPAVIIVRHWRNIRRMRNGTEERLF